MLCFGDRIRLQLPQAFAPLLEVAHHARIGQHLQMLGDGLPADVGAGRELGNGKRPARTQHGNQLQPRRIAQRGEHGRQLFRNQIFIG